MAENSGGVHCLKYGLTTNNVLGIEMVLITGEIIRLGGKHLDSEGYDLLGLMTGSEGLLGVVTEVTVRILQKPETARAVLVGFRFDEGGRPMRGRHHRRRHHAGRHGDDGPARHPRGRGIRSRRLSLDVEALLIVELDGPAAEVRSSDRAGRGDRPDATARSGCAFREARRERLLFWAGRKAAFPAVGRISPDYLCMDGTIPRAKLPQVLKRMRELSAKYGLRVANVFHAGDGNLHPLILYDANMPDELERAEEFGADILRLCVKVGGVLTGEHGVGVEKRDLMPEMFSRDRSRAAAARQMRFRCRGPAQPRQGLSHPAPLRRARPRACSRGAGAFSRYSEVLKRLTMITAGDRTLNAARVARCTRPVRRRRVPRAGGSGCGQ